MYFGVYLYWFAALQKTNTENVTVFFENLKKECGS